MKKLYGFSLFFFCYIANAQRYLWSPDSLLMDDPNYAMDRYHDVLRYHDPLMYLAIPHVKPVAHRSIPLLDGEGKKGYWSEGNFAYRFVIYKGKYYSYPFFQRLRFTFDVSLTPRLTRDESSPLLPSNNKFGIGADFLFSGLSQLRKAKTTLVFTTIQFHHYSNGQADSFFIKGPLQRNNYRSGDFSTNYVKVMLSIAGTSQQRSIVTGAIGYQKEVEMSGPFARSKELRQYYGDHRLHFQFQWLQKPRLVTRNYQNRATVQADTVQLERRRQLAFRTELEYIPGALLKFQGDNKRRIGWHSYFMFMPSVTNEVGLMAHTFLGRDYLNIRFDDIVFIVEVGLLVKFNAK